MYNFARRSNQKRFATKQEIIQNIAETNSLPATLKPSLCENLGLEKGIKLISLSKVNTRGVGATQCHPYVMTFENGHKIFLKLTPKSNCSAMNQKMADHNIKTNCSEEELKHFVLMMHNIKNIASDKAENDILFFPYVPGHNLYLAIAHQYQSDEQKQQCYFAIGQVLAQAHIGSMNKTETFEDFLSTGILPMVLVHDDWQATNVMITPDFEGKIIDTEGTKLSSNRYRNFKETWEMCFDDKACMRVFLEGYIRSFPETVRVNLLADITKNLAEKYGLDFIQELEIVTSLNKTNQNRM